MNHFLNGFVHELTKVGEITPPRPIAPVAVAAPRPIAPPKPAGITAGDRSLFSTIKQRVKAKVGANPRKVRIKSPRGGVMGVRG